MCSLSRFRDAMRKHKAPLSLTNNISPDLEFSVRGKGKLEEVKHRIGKSTQKFFIENWKHTDNVCVGRYVPEEDTAYGSLKGSYSWGVWWKDADIGVYRIHDPYGNLVTYRIDILDNVILRKEDSLDIIEFRDLIVDCWMWPDDHGNISAGNTTIDDLDELDDARSKGLISIAECDNISSIVFDVLSDPLKHINLVDNAILDAVKYNMH